MVPIEVPELVRRRAETNAHGREWLDALPDVLTHLARHWGLTYGRSYSGGTAGLVIAAERGNEPVVVKIPMQLDMHEVDAVRHAITAHRLADGRGCAQLLASHDDPPALLLERLGPNLDDLGSTLDEILDAIADTFLDFWRPVPGGIDLMTGAEKAAWLADYIERTSDELDGPLSAPVIDLAMAFCRERADAHDVASAVLCHGDAHGWNTLDAGGGRCKFVDPEGLVAERAADLAVPMREYNDPLLAGDTVRLVRERAERLGQRCDVDPEAIWQWGFMERVSTGLANLRDFGADDAAPFLEVAERCAMSR